MTDTENLLEVELPPSPHGIIWHAPGSRSYNMGADRGVLYPENGPGVAWDGLVSVNLQSTGGDIQAFYSDGVRRRNDHFLEEFEATITAYASPREFGPCVGEVEIAPGMYIAQQMREPFGFSYRTYAGDDLQGMTANYELHLIYQAMVSPASVSHKTMDSKPSASTMSWDIETVPIDIKDAKPSAHVKMESKRVDSVRLKEIEDILYGWNGLEPRLPELTELIEILTRPIEDEEIEDIPWEPIPLE